VEQATSREVRMTALRGVPWVRPGDDLVAILTTALRESAQTLRDGDLLVIAQKIVSKAEGRIVELTEVKPSERAVELAKIVDKDPRLLELILRESTEVLRARRDVIVVVHRLGFVMANAGIDFSNIEQPGEDRLALLLPLDPDASCQALRQAVREKFGVQIAVIINDSHGRAWRNGTVGVAIGASGLPAVADLRGQPDLFGRALRITQVGMADECAAAASLLMGQAGEATPIVLIRGLALPAIDGRARDLIRSAETDMFRG
jgi:coenzyme F420-0:L-glutamate ligase / coenzyme F420-1:gamma-L-glutamate ligase